MPTNFRYLLMIIVALGLCAVVIGLSHDDERDSSLRPARNAGGSSPTPSTQLLPRETGGLGDAGDESEDADSTSAAGPTTLRTLEAVIENAEGATAPTARSVEVFVLGSDDRPIYNVGERVRILVQQIPAGMVEKPWAEQLAVATTEYRQCDEPRPSFDLKPDHLIYLSCFPDAKCVGPEEYSMWQIDAHVHKPHPNGFRLPVRMFVARVLDHVGSPAKQPRLSAPEAGGGATSSYQRASGEVVLLIPDGQKRVVVSAFECKSLVFEVPDELDDEATIIRLSQPSEESTVLSDWETHTDDLADAPDLELIVSCSVPDEGEYLDSPPEDSVADSPDPDTTPTFSHRTPSRRFPLTVPIGTPSVTITSPVLALYSFTDEWRIVEMAKESRGHATVWRFLVVRLVNVKVLLWDQAGRQLTFSEPTGKWPHQTPKPFSLRGSAVWLGDTDRHPVLHRTHSQVRATPGGVFDFHLPKGRWKLVVGISGEPEYDATLVVEAKAVSATVEMRLSRVPTLESLTIVNRTDAEPDWSRAMFIGGNLSVSMLPEIRENLERMSAASARSARGEASTETGPDLQVLLGSWLRVHLGIVAANGLASGTVSLRREHYSHYTVVVSGGDEVFLGTADWEVGTMTVSPAHLAPMSLLRTGALEISVTTESLSGADVSRVVFVPSALKTNGVLLAAESAEITPPRDSRQRPFAVWDGIARLTWSKPLPIQLPGLSESFTSSASSRALPEGTFAVNLGWKRAVQHRNQDGQVVAVGSDYPKDTAWHTFTIVAGQTTRLRFVLRERSDVPTGEVSPED